MPSRASVIRLRENRTYGSKWGIGNRVRKSTAPPITNEPGRTGPNGRARAVSARGRVRLVLGWRASVTRGWPTPGVEKGLGAEGAVLDVAFERGGRCGVGGDDKAVAEVLVYVRLDGSVAGKLASADPSYVARRQPGQDQAAADVHAELIAAPVSRSVRVQPVLQTPAAVVLGPVCLVNDHPASGHAGVHQEVAVPYRVDPARRFGTSGLGQSANWEQGPQARKTKGSVLNWPPAGPVIGKSRGYATRRDRHAEGPAPPAGTAAAVRAGTEPEASPCRCGRRSATRPQQ